MIYRYRRIGYTYIRQKSGNFVYLRAKILAHDNDNKNITGN